MARFNHSNPAPFLLLLSSIVPIIFFFLISPCGAHKLRKRNLLTSMDITSSSSELLANDGEDNDGTAAQFEHLLKAIGEEKNKPLIEWPQGWRRFLLRKFGRTLPISGIKAKTMPCCAESIGQHVCTELRNRNPSLFRKRCRTDADFAILQCCRSCRTNVAELGREMFATGVKSRHCFDRHNRQFCAHFVHQSGLWATNVGKSVNCNGDGAPLAFRVCRRSCGFCEPELYQQQNQNCISKVWKMTTNGASTTTNGEHWKSLKVKTTTPKQPRPFTFPRSSSSTMKPTKSVVASSRKATTESATRRSTAPPRIVRPFTRRPIRPPPRLLPCTVPPLPPLPSIPVPTAPWSPSTCLPLEPLAPLKPLTTATIDTTTYSAPQPEPTTDDPFPLSPLSPIDPPLANRRRSGTTITITWKPSSSTGGIWPELPIPLPDEIIEAILNKLSGIDDNGDYTVGECKECGEKARKEKEGEESVGSMESAERREGRENSAEKSEQNGKEEAEEGRQTEEGVAQLILDILLKAAKWAGGESGEERRDQQTDKRRAK
ncbi:hypothetical protein niasHT_038815 [Heterodera trifolii]|uniref:ShKT domain-containing protein n=1 Tax=Heterodera trifolii TaxID=157864 RepID=A0ABD2I1Q0_9BILA